MYQKRMPDIAAAISDEMGAPLPLANARPDDYALAKRLASALEIESPRQQA